MPCAVCLQANQSAKNLYNDCILEYLEKIKLHYLDLKTKCNDQLNQIDKLQIINSELLRLNSPKRRKTSSFEESPMLSDKSTNDCFNDAIKLESSCDGSFFVATQPSSAGGNGAAPTPNNILKPSNKSPDCKTPPPPPPSIESKAAPGSGFLPRRYRGTPVSSRQSNVVGRENKSSQWVSKENISKGDVNVGVVKRDRNMSFIQPAVPLKVVNSPRADVVLKSPLRNVLSLKKEASLKQMRLKFDTTRLIVEKDETVVPETDATFCADFVAASPVCLATIDHETTKPKFRTNRKLNRQRIETTTKKSYPTKLDIKIESQSAVKKAIDFDSRTTECDLIAPATPPPLQSSSLSSRTGLTLGQHSISKIAENSDSSVCILESQPNDVIIVDDTHSSLNIESDALIGELMKGSDETSDFLRGIEKKSILNLKQQQDKQNEIARSLSGNISPGIIPNRKDIKTSPSVNPRETHDPKDNATIASIKVEPIAARSKTIPKWNCKDCESYYALAGKNMPEHELFKRIQHCVENHKRVVCETPEGFWNPCFAPTQDDDDPRFRTLIDTKIDEKKK